MTTLLLDKMRRIKNRMVRLKTRVETIRELLEKFLEDEGDMKSMNLTARQVPQLFTLACTALQVQLLHIQHLNYLNFVDCFQESALLHLDCSLHRVNGQLNSSSSAPCFRTRIRSSSSESPCYTHTVVLAGSFQVVAEHTKPA